MKLSIIIPCYNEEQTLDAILQRVWDVDLGEASKQIVIVDDGSRDRSVQIANRWRDAHPETIDVVELPANQGKGAAVREGLGRADGDIVIIQDADLEYDPDDYRVILARYADPSVQVVYGSRILGSRNRSYQRYYWGGRFLSLVTNLLYGCNITDEPTCYKSLRREVLARIRLSSRGFEFCPELTGKLLRLGYRIHEAPIRYYPRSLEQGKKIRPKDGVIAIWTLIKCRLWD